MLPSRIAIHMEGVEWFLFNRTWSYDDMLAKFTTHNDGESLPMDGMAQHLAVPLHGSTRASNTRTSRTAMRCIQRALIRAGKHGYLAMLFFPWQVSSLFFAKVMQIFPSFNWMEVLPIGLHVLHGAIILGAPSTQSLFVIRFSEAQGAYGVTSVRAYCSANLYPTLPSHDASLTFTSRSWR